MVNVLKRIVKVIINGVFIFISPLIFSVCFLNAIYALFAFIATGKDKLYVIFYPVDFAFQMPDKICKLLGI